VGAHQNPVQRAVVLVLAVICTLLDGAFDALVGMTIHKNASFDFGYGASMAQCRGNMLENVSKVAFCAVVWYFNMAKCSFVLQR